MNDEQIWQILKNQSVMMRALYKIMINQGQPGRIDASGIREEDIKEWGEILTELSNGMKDTDVELETLCAKI